MSSAFLAAIVAAPDDDAPRLVYADHLLESADERERQRGELIVAQCAIASLPRQSEEWRRARERERLLLTLFAEPPKGQTWRVREWERGFPRRLQGTPKKLLRARKSLVEQPFREIALLDGTSVVQPTLGELATLVKTFPQIERLRLKNNEASATLDPKALAHLAEGSVTLAWRDDALPNQAIRDALLSLYVADTLVADPHGGLTPYVNDPFPRLEELTMRSRNPNALMAMSNRPLKKLSWLTEGDAQLAPIAKLASLGRIEELDLDVRFDAELAKALSSAPLTSLAFRRDATEDAFAQWTPPATLRHLTLLFPGTAWYDVSKARFRLLPGDYPALESLALARFVLGDSFAALTFPALWKLELVECVVAPSGLASLLRHDGLHRPSFLRCEFLGDAEAQVRARWPDASIQ